LHVFCHDGIDCDVRFLINSISEMDVRNVHNGLYDWFSLLLYAPAVISWRMWNL
jgi:hypothetical protein